MRKRKQGGPAGEGWLAGARQRPPRGIPILREPQAPSEADIRGAVESIARRLKEREEPKMRLAEQKLKELEEKRLEEEKQRNDQKTESLITKMIEQGKFDPALPEGL